jgi:large subunit ribosomal protein L25
MDFAKVSAEVRQETGKGFARRTRAAGRVPAVLYGRREQPLTLSLDPLALVRSLDKERKRNTVFSLSVSQKGKEGTASDITAMVRDVQIHPLSRRIVHIDFLRVDLNEEVRVEVPLVLKGTPAGVVDGGNLHHNVHSIAIAAKPADIPTKIELDVSALKIGEALHVSDLKLPTGQRALLDAKIGLASVVAPRAEKAEEAAAAAAPAEGAAAAAPGKEGAPAAGAKGAAAAPAAGKEGEKKAPEKKK